MRREEEKKRKKKKKNTGLAGTPVAGWFARLLRHWRLVSALEQQEERANE